MSTSDDECMNVSFKEDVFDVVLCSILGVGVLYVISAFYYNIFCPRKPLPSAVANTKDENFKDSQAIETPSIISVTLCTFFGKATKW